MNELGWTDAITKRDLYAFEERLNLRFETLARRLDVALAEDQLRSAMAAHTELIRRRTKTLLLIHFCSALSAFVLTFGGVKLT